ncbi:MAG: helicase, partial [Verrucomicrobiota bacterium]|nr:helicase [Verrucomicrobiota bacterium]
ARMLLAAQEHHCVRAIALIAAVTQGRNLLRRAEGKQAREDRDDLLGGDDDSDLFILTRAFRFAEKNNFDPRRCSRLSVNAMAAREAAQLWEQFISIARAEGLEVEAREAEPGAIQRCVLAGFPDQVAMRLDQGTLRCALVHGRRGVLARESVVHRASLIVASEIREIESSEKERQVLLTLATRIEEEWLRELFPEAFQEKIEVAFDSVSRRVIGKRQTTFHDLVLHSEAADVPPNKSSALLAREVLSGSCPLKNWDNSVEQWIVRVNCVANWFPELELPNIGEAEKLLMIEEVCRDAVSYKEIKERAVWPAVKSWLNSQQQQQIEQLAPERILLPNNRKAKITYSASTPPTVAARIQDLYGVERNLTIGRGRVPLVMQVLAPNNRPIQITSDLAGFWKDGYPKIKKELQRKYPKHEWR